MYICSTGDPSSDRRQGCSPAFMQHLQRPLMASSPSPKAMLPARIWALSGDACSRCEPYWLQTTAEASVLRCVTMQMLPLQSVHETLIFGARLRATVALTKTGRS